MEEDLAWGETQTGRWSTNIPNIKITGESINIDQVRFRVWREFYQP